MITFLKQRENRASNDGNCHGKVIDSDSKSNISSARVVVDFR